jgi:hypothetical protein
MNNKPSVVTLMEQIELDVTPYIFRRLDAMFRSMTIKEN